MAELVARQGGVITRRQLEHCGFTNDQIHRSRRRGELIPLHQAVFAVGHVPVSRTSHQIAALLAAGPTAVLSHYDSALVHGLRIDADAKIHITTPTRVRRSTPTLQPHVAKLDRADWHTRRHMRTTTPERLLLDMADLLDDRPYEALVAEAKIRDLANPTAIAHLIKRSPGRRTTRLQEATGLVGRTRSEMERRLLRILRAAKLPLPSMNVVHHGWELDAFWPDHALAVELDSWTFHNTRQAFRTDRRKDRALRRRGISSLRYTWDDLADGTAARELGEELRGSARADPGPRSRAAA